MNNPMDLTDKHILVAGASSGIGAEVARQITRLGGKVSLLARREDKLQEVVASLEEQRGKYYALDFVDTDEIEKTMAVIYQEQGAFNGAVYSVGVSENRPLKLVRANKMQKIVAANYLGFVEFVRCVTLKRFRAKTMSIVGVSSTASRKGDKGKIMYCSTKAAMNGAMRAMAHELADYNIRVNNVLPGWVKTAIYDETMKQIGEDAMHKRIVQTQYLGGGVPFRNNRYS